MADTNPSPGGTAAQSTGELAPQLRAAMKRDLGVTDDHAAAQVKRAKWASGVATKLRAETENSYAGSWLTGSGMTLNVGITDPALADTVRAAGATPKIVEHSGAQLNSAKQALDSTATKSDRTLVGWYVDVASNKVAVQALPGAASKARKLAADAGIPANSVKVVTVKAKPKLLADVVGAQAYFVSLAEGTARCSVGFGVEGGFVTAGHCGPEGTKTLDSKEAAQGTVSASVFPGDADFGVVKADAGVTPQPFVDDFKGNALPIAGSTEAPVGAAICRSGSTTGLHCGTILATDQTVNYQEGSVTGLTQTDVCAEGGDSGGPFLSGDQAQGITSGGSGDCTAGGETFFQPVNEILETNKLTLLTSTGDGGASSPPADGGDASAPPTDGASEPPADGGDASAPPADGASEPPADGGDASAPPADGGDASAPPADGASEPPADGGDASTPPADNGGTGGNGANNGGHPRRHHSR